MARAADDWAKMSEDEFRFMLHSAQAGSEDFEHAKAELEYRRTTSIEEACPDLEWSSKQSAEKGIPARYPFAPVELCPRYYLSLALLGESGVTTASIKLRTTDFKRNGGSILVGRERLSRSRES